jgi:hypothetical protein
MYICVYVCVVCALHMCTHCVQDILKCICRVCVACVICAYRVNDAIAAEACPAQKLADSRGIIWDSGTAGV